MLLQYVVALLFTKCIFNLVVCMLDFMTKSWFYDVQTGFYVEDSKEKLSATETKVSADLQDTEVNGKIDAAKPDVYAKDETSEEGCTVEKPTVDSESPLTSENNEVRNKTDVEQAKHEVEIHNEDIEEIEVEEFYVKYKNLWV